MKLQSILTGVAALAMTTSAFAAPFNTCGTPWFQGSTGTGTATVCESPIPNSSIWVANGGSAAAGQWVGFTGNDGNPANGGAAGVYVYSIILPAGGTAFSLMYAADNAVTWSITGGSLTSGTTACPGPICFDSLRSLGGTYSTGAILVATVTNLTVTPNPTGLLVQQANTNDAIPEPSTYAMMGLGAAALVFARLRRK